MAACERRAALPDTSKMEPNHAADLNHASSGTPTPLHTIDQLRLADIMTRRVHCVSPACTLEHAASSMAKARVSCIVVAEGDHPVGILTDRDLVRLIHLRIPGAAPISQIMSQPVVTAHPDLDFRAAYALLRHHAVRHLLVVDHENGSALGVVTLTDFLSHIGTDFFHRVKSLRAVTEPVLATLPPSATLAKALRLMVEIKSDLLLVTREEQAVGILTEGDMARLLTDHPDPEAVRLQSVMSAPVHSISPEATVSDAVSLLASHDIRHLPVVDAQGQVMGIVNQTRLLEKLGIELFDEAWRRGIELDQARRRLESNLLMVMEATGSGTWEYDHATDCHTWSASVAALLGCPHECLPRSLDDWLAMVHTEDIAAFERAIVASAARGDQIVEAEYRVRQTGGSWLWLHERTRVLERDAGGQPLRTVGILQDITARKRADRRLDQERQNLRQLFDTMEDYLFVVGHDSRILHINQAVSRLGYGADLIGQSIFSVHPPEYAEDAEQMFEEIRAGTRGQCPIPLIKADGERIAVDTRAVCGEWDGVPAIFGVSRDIREQIAQREALETERRRLQTLIRSIPDPVWIKDLEGRYLACNAVFERMYGASEGEILGKTDFDFVDEDTARFFRHNDRAAADAGGPLMNEEWLDFKQDGYRGLFETIKTPTLDAQGKLIGVLGIARDITAARQAQEALKEREEIYSAIVNQAMDGIVLIDTDTLGFAEFNEAACQTLGYSRDEFAALSLDDIQCDLSREEVEARMGQILSGSFQLVFEIRHRHKNGQARDMRVSNRVINIHGQTYLAAVWQDITDQKQAARSLQDAHMFLEETQSIARVGGWKANPMTDEVLWTDEVFRLLERPVNHPPKTLEESLTYCASAIQPQVRRNLMTAWETGAPFTMECEMVAESGRHFFAELRCVGRVEEPGGSFLTGTFQDISERKQLEDEIRLRERYHRAVLDNFPFPVWLKDRESRFLSVNWPFARYFSQPSPESLVGKTDYDIAAPEYAALCQAEDRAVLESGAPRNVEEPIEHGGRTVWNETYKSPVHLNGQVIGTVGYARDISARKEAEARVAFLAYHDPLTSLPNRTLAKDRAEQAMNLAERSGSKAALLFLDVDNFKTINDSLGHPVGDALLQEVAARLRACVRDTDTISRQGGDEFLILLPELRDAECIESVLDKILSRLALPIRVEDHELSTTLSIGVAVYPDDGRDFDTLFRRADTAMYRAKEAGRNTYRFFAPQMNVEATEHLRLRTHLHHALARGELSLHFQPQIRLCSETVTGAEALLRWHNPELGQVVPERFIAIAEDCGLIESIGEWVLGEACRQAAAWQAATGAELSVAVNLSPVQFRRGDLPAHVARVLAESGLKPSLLELEITESLLLQHTEIALATVRELKSLGVKLAIDDFGTGYSSLAYLKRFNVDTLKIDQSFVRDMVNDPVDAAIVRATIQMARSLNLATIAEGVETEQQLRFLGEHHCDTAQGYFYARPMTSDEFSAYLKGSVQRQARHETGSAAADN